MSFKFLQPKTDDERPLNCNADASTGEHSTVCLDNDLVRRARNGEIAAFEELFTRQQKRIYNIAIRMLHDEDDAADATQEVFVRAYHSINKLKSDAAFVTWIKILALNICRDMLRKRGRSKVQSLDAPVDSDDGGSMSIEIADWSGNPERAFDKKQVQESVQRAIGLLSPSFREVVTLFYVDGASVDKIAQIVGAPVGTVKSRLSRARAELKRKLEWYVRENGGSNG